MNTVPRIDFTGTKITHINTHFNCLIQFILDSKNVCYFLETLSRGAAYGKESHSACQHARCQHWFQIAAIGGATCNRGINRYLKWKLIFACSFQIIGTNQKINELDNCILRVEDSSIINDEWNRLNRPWKMSYIRS